MDFNLGFPELVTLAVIAVLLFGPEKLPELARKFARVVKYLRGIANDAREQVRGEFGDEVADFDPRKLNARSLAVSVLGADTVDELNAASSELRELPVRVEKTVADEDEPELEADDEEPELVVVRKVDLDAT
ncbi:MAG: twin-arginine translocase TatA/TatE family subunit [Propionibacteriaceae bacterium]|jgi:sec-independent protein translocase protein TatB|nr:twin-arginine translocase TatA/TatE family subunit [Propionibacteriaceae bacterium]